MDCIDILATKIVVSNQNVHWVSPRIIIMSRSFALAIYLTWLCIQGNMAYQIDGAIARISTANVEFIWNFMEIERAIMQSWIDSPVQQQNIIRPTGTYRNRFNASGFRHKHFTRFQSEWGQPTKHNLIVFFIFISSNCGGLQGVTLANGYVLQLNFELFPFNIQWIIYCSIAGTTRVNWNSIIGKCNQF